MHVLVTGGAGYIGSISVRSLLDAGHSVTVLDTLERGHREAVDARARLVVGDVGAREACLSALEGCSGVLHCAGYIDVAESMREPELYMLANAVRPATLLGAMAETGISSFVFSSTAAVYGEPQWLPITEDHALEPVNWYGRSKLAFEGLLDTNGRDLGLRSVRFRYFNAAGAWPDGSLGEAHDPETHIVPRVLAVAAAGGGEFEIFGEDYRTRDGTCVRDYVHVMDLAAAHLLALEALEGSLEGGTFNLGNGQGYTNREVVRECAQVTGVRIAETVGPRREGDPAKLLASAELARTVLGWTPRYGALSEMIAHAWAWHSAHPEGYRSA
ncbi:MAG: UDP-glucose 4-epimerase GalE [Coriobacteriaceae bacterium]|nr:UDP-glucose 4-epimerase GalE [Coriobacteriaceae bacterium]